MGAHAECGKNYEILLFAALTNVLTRKSNTRLGAGPIMGQTPHCAEKNFSQKLGICPGGMGGVRIDWYIRQLRGLDSKRSRIFRSNYVTTLNPRVTK